MHSLWNTQPVERADQASRRDRLIFGYDESRRHLIQMTADSLLIDDDQHLPLMTKYNNNNIL